MARRPVLRLACATLLSGVIGLSFVGAATARAGSAHIAARPKSVMVNTATMLAGKNFAPSTQITIEECSAKNWVVPRSPCDSTNSVTVTTSRRGTFKSSFTVQTCLSGGDAAPGFAEKCYIGVPTPDGIDTVTLVGAVRITVTGP